MIFKPTESDVVEYASQYFDGCQATADTPGHPCCGFGTEYTLSPDSAWKISINVLFDDGGVDSESSHAPTRNRPSHDQLIPFTAPLPVPAPEFEAKPFCSGPPMPIAGDTEAENGVWFGSNDDDDDADGPVPVPAPDVVEGVHDNVHLQIQSVVSQRVMRASLPPTARYRPLGARETERHEDVCACKVWRGVNEGKETMSTDPRPVVRKRSRSEESKEYENAVALVSTPREWGGEALYAVEEESGVTLVDIGPLLLGVDGLGTDIGTSVLS